MSPSDPHASCAPFAPFAPFASFAEMGMLKSALGRVFAPWVREVGPRVLDVRACELTLALPVTDKHVHEGGVICGQTMMTACDTAMVLAGMTKLGGFKR